MKRKLLSQLFTFLLMISFSGFSYGQKASIVKKDYARNSLTMLVLDYGDSPYMESFRSPGRLKVTDKFDDNSLNFTLLQAGFPRSAMNNSAKMVQLNMSMSGKNQMSPDFVEPLYNRVKELKIPNAIIALEFNRQADGSFNMDVIAKRGMYNADEAAYSQAQATLRKDNALRDAGELLLNNSYILVFDYSSIKTMTEIYNERDARSEQKAKRTQNGYKANGKAYLYRIAFSDSVYSTFLNTMWIDETTNEGEKAQKRENFDHNIFPIERIAVIGFDAEALQYNADQGALAPKVQKTPEQLFDELITGSRNDVITSLEKIYSKFRVTSQISQTHPIGVKIGSKEGLKLDQRFFVYEQQFDHQGREFSKRMGVIRSKSVSENRFNISDKQGVYEPSLFYQTAGKKLHNVGMFVEQKNDLGMGFCIGYMTGGLSGANLSLEYNIMSLFNAKSGITALKLYVGGGVNYASYLFPSSIAMETTDPLFFWRVEGGLAKDMYFLRNFYIGPVIGFGLENAGITDDMSIAGTTGKISYQTLYGTGGLRFGFNLLHNLQLQLNANYYLPVGSVTKDFKDADGNSLSGFPADITAGWSDLFEGRKGLGFGGGLRLQF